MSNVVNLNRKKDNYSMEELFMNHTDTQNEVNTKVKKHLQVLNRKYESMRIAFIMALIVIVVGCIIGTCLAINKLNNMTYTIYIDGQNQTVDIDKLKAAPLEEIK